MIKIVTDSTAYLPEETIRKHDIRIVPLYVHFGNEAFREGVELSNKEFYTRLAEAPELPTTSQPPPGDFEPVFKELAGAGHEILVLTISSKLSGTWESAIAAKKMLPEASIHVFDSFSTSVGLHLIVDAALKGIEAGLSAPEIVAKLEEIRPKVRFMFAVDTLEYLQKGGRIGNARAFLGTLLKVKPILFLQDGAIEPLEQVRSRRKVQARLVELAQEYLGEKGSGAKVAVAHALAEAEAEALKHNLVKELGCGESLFAEIGPVIGTHTGPGVLGVAIYA